VLLTRWALEVGTWQVVAAEVVRVETAPSP
jgi:hypothetical protein